MKKPYGSYPPEVAVNRIAQWEGVCYEAYQDSVGVWTIGVGHTGGVQKGDVIDHAEAMRLLASDLKRTVDGLAPHVKVGVSEGQFIAITSLAFNIGVNGVVNGCPKLMAALNAGDWEECARQFLDCDKAGGIRLSGLTRRRREEADLFMQEVS